MHHQNYRFQWEWVGQTSIMSDGMVDTDERVCQFSHNPQKELNVNNSNDYPI